MNAVRLWWGLTDRGNLLSLTSRFLLLGFFLKPDLHGPWLVLGWVWIAVSAKRSWRLDAAYASLSVPRVTWARHRKADAAVESLANVGLTLWVFPWLSGEQLVFFLTIALFFLWAIVRKPDDVVLGNVDEPPEGRVNSHQSVERGGWPWRRIAYPETLTGQSILRPQATVWLGWGLGAMWFAACVAVASRLFDVAALGGFTLIVAVATTAMGAVGEEKIQLSYAQWVRFGGARTVWARWTALLCVIPVCLAVMIGAFLGLTEGVGAGRGAAFGLGYALVVVPCVVLFAVIGRNNAIWVVAAVAGMAVCGALGFSEAVTATQWFLLQGGLGVGVGLGLPLLIRGAAHELGGLGAFFAFRRAGVD
ncbi:hypothetical protein H7347_08205 [Corynebacterium sp. zg-331]|uniref:hypothetical protein n=1 Tax=unclassified Corynebacterium TaxID=2624378 RepID=UPI00128B1F52|nr:MULTISPECIES: hypothetical protein [unclassified Corynebacterium]MBC3186550.1 hypothetical protein [Corynebacterium sp. zg-331]MPV53033.1 hypothetical protein [Corynebacterium sp. zg331]